MEAQEPRPAGYEPSKYPPFAVTVDLVVLTVRAQRLNALVVRRGRPPYAGRWALPGGFVLAGEDLPAAAARELAEEAGLDAREPSASEAPPGAAAGTGRGTDTGGTDTGGTDTGGGAIHLEQLATYGAPDRDPRMRVVSVAYLALAPDLPTPVAGTDAAAARWAPVDDLLAGPERLAFDHHQILGDGVERARAKLEYTPLATAFCPQPFTIAELRRVYEAVWGTALDPRNFHRKVSGTPGFLVPAGEATTRDGGRPARLYRAGSLKLLHPPMLRPGRDG